MRSYMSLLLYVLVFAHFLVVIGNIVAFFILPLYTPWYVWLPVESFLLNLFFNDWKCPLTTLENEMRFFLDLKPINTFIGHYIKKPIYIALKIPKQGE